MIVLRIIIAHFHLKVNPRKNVLRVFINFTRVLAKAGALPSANVCVRAGPTLGESRSHEQAHAKKAVIPLYELARTTPFPKFDIFETKNFEF